VTTAEENLTMAALLNLRHGLLKEADLTISRVKAKRLKAEARAADALIEKIENGDYE